MNEARVEIIVGRLGRLLIAEPWELAPESDNGLRIFQVRAVETASPEHGTRLLVQLEEPIEWERRVYPTLSIELGEREESSWPGPLPCTAIGLLATAPIPASPSQASSQWRGGLAIRGDVFFDRDPEAE